VLSLGGTPGADEHVLAGARLFRDGRFEEALVEFRVAERLGAADARGYAAAALVKLGQPEQALELFEGPGARAEGVDALLDHYHALACYGARLYLCADGLLERVGKRSGPRVAEQAARIRADLAAVLKGEPSADAVDWYLARADANAREGRLVLAIAHAREARALGLRRADRYGVAPAEARLARLAPAREVDRR
jgi:tetratricopeptide (TPR) repeat protein